MTRSKKFTVAVGNRGYFVGGATITVKKEKTVVDVRVDEKNEGIYVWMLLLLYAAHAVAPTPEIEEGIRKAVLAVDPSASLEVEVGFPNTGQPVSGFPGDIPF